MKSPCKDCTDRHYNCHSECEIYQEFHRERNEKSRREQRERYKEAAYMGVRSKHKKDE